MRASIYKLDPPQRMPIMKLKGHITDYLYQLEQLELRRGNKLVITQKDNHILISIVKGEVDL